MDSVWLAITKNIPEFHVLTNGDTEPFFFQHLKFDLEIRTIYVPIVKQCFYYWNMKNLHKTCCLVKKYYNTWSSIKHFIANFIFGRMTLTKLRVYSSDLVWPQF